MLKFLFGKAAGKAAVETQRQTVERAVEELNTVLAGMADKAVIGVDLNSGLLKVDLPDQMPDEALALPAPEAEEIEQTEGPIRPNRRRRRQPDPISGHQTMRLHVPVFA